MSELINTQVRQGSRKQLLATASALALTAYVSSMAIAKAEDTDRPTVWVELGGQAEMTQGTSSLFAAPFMSLTPVPAPYRQDSLIDTQHPPRFSFGLEGKIMLQPEGSDWLFSAALRYGRAHTDRHIHHQSTPLVPRPTANKMLVPMSVAAFADTKFLYDESQTIVDFTAGRDVGLGMFGHGSTSVVNAGVRFAQFSVKSSAAIYARPEINVFKIPPKYLFYGNTFHNYTMLAHAERSFHGVGPSLSWSASADLLGNADSGELLVEWGINGALLFGRQKAATDHSTQAYQHTRLGGYPMLYQHPAIPSARARSVVVPNLGGFAGLSVKYPNAKVSVGYRADFFFGAVDAGIDERKNKDLGFNGPFATISIGLGG